MFTRLRCLIPLSLLILAAACTSPAGSALRATALAFRRTEPPKPFSITVIHTNDTWGYLLPCG
jgi:2',3'-cyclic-nucleotide 2'-phosphodiesterase (5'-nucleotidase family)